jgi:3'(2'), 5'-bisphosphate nucleotidase
MLEQIDIQKIVKIAREAGEVIMEIYQKDFAVEYKDDKSPLTEADRQANEVILKGLNTLSVVFPILSEEGKDVPFEERKEWEYFWMVDPLDGTKEFIKKNDEFTVNIALIHRNEPVLGVVYAPALDEMYWAKRGEGAFKNGRKLPAENNEDPSKILRVVASKSHLSAETQEYIDALGKTTESIECVSKGSSLKLCMVAEGNADVYPRLAPTMEWDTAAADAVVREAGKMSFQFEHELPLQYNKENLLNPWFVVR